jgi:hypothetical protein
MKNLLKKKFFLLLFFLITSFAFSQTIFIVTDFQNCGTGLKDSATGKWIVEPTYQEIRKEGFGFYKVISGSKEGIVNSKGQIIIPAVYDYVNFNNYGIDSLHPNYLFEVQNGKKYGVLNINGNFIVPLKCKDVDVTYDGDIIARTARKRYSLYHSDGSELKFKKKMSVAPVYIGDNLFMVGRNSFGLSRDYFWWNLKIKQKYGVVNDSLREIIPKKYNDINYNPSFYKLITVIKKKKTGYYSNAGKLIWKPVFKDDFYYNSSHDYYWEGGDDGFDYSPMNDNGFEAVSVNKKYGIISATGDTILPFKYDYIYQAGDNNEDWYVEKNYMRGIYNPSEKKWVLPLEYDDIESEFYYSLNGDSAAVALLLVTKDGKSGMMTSSGQEIIPVIYDDYVPMEGGYIFFKGNDYIAVTFPECRHGSKNVNPYYYQLDGEKIVTTISLNGQFKRIEKPNGIILFINPDLVNDSAQKSLYRLVNKNVKTNTETYDSLLHATAVIITPLKQESYFPGKGPVFKFSKTDLHFLNSYAPTEFCVDTSNHRYRYIQTVYLDGTDSFYQYYNLNGRGLYRSDGKVLVPRGRSSFNFMLKTVNGLAIFRVQSAKGKEGIMDGNGKLLIDTTWAALGEMKNNYIWVVKKSENYFPNYYDYNILDTTTHKLLLTKKQTSSNDGTLGEEAAIIIRSNGPKLFNYKTQTFIVNGNANNIIKLDDDGYFFAVRTCSGKIGVIGGDGKWLTDTIWTTLIRATNNLPAEDASPYDKMQANISYDYCVLSNDTGWIIFDGANKRITRDLASVNYLLKKSENSFTLDSSIYSTQFCSECLHYPDINKFCRDCPSWYLPEHPSVNLRPWQSNLLFDSLFTGETFITDSTNFWIINTCKECMKKNVRHNYEYVWGKNYDRTILNHTLRFVNDSVISVTREDLSGYYRYANDPSDIFFTIMLFKDGPHEMLLDSLFIGTEWKKMITTEVMNYLDTNLYITGNCSNPYMLPLVMKNRFSISEEGILIYPPGYKEKSNQLAILLTWQKLKPYLRKDVASKIGVK